MRNLTDEEVFPGLLKRARPRLQALLTVFGVAPQDCEDVLQEVFLALWRKRFQVENHEAWLLRALQVECLRYLRRKGRRRDDAVDEPTLEFLAGPDGFSEAGFDLRQDLRMLIGRLPARHQALLYLRYELGLTPEETARQLGYQVSSLKKTTTRCLCALRKELLSRRPFA